MPGVPTAKIPKTVGRDNKSVPRTSSATWLLYVEDHTGMFCTLCTKYNKEPRSGKSIWMKEPCTLFCLPSVH